TAPCNLVREKSSEPYRGANRIAHRYKPKLGRNTAISQAPHAGGVGHAQTQNQICHQIKYSQAGPPSGRRDNCGQNRPRQTMRENHACVASRPHIAKPDGPTQFMPQEFPESFLREDHRNWLAHQLDTMSLACNAIAQLEIV